MRIWEEEPVSRGQRGDDGGRDAARMHLQKVTALRRGGFALPFRFLLVIRKECVGGDDVALITPASRDPGEASKWTRIELRVINLWKAPLEGGEHSQAFVFICQDMSSDVRRYRPERGENILRVVGGRRAPPDVLLLFAFSCFCPERKKRKEKMGEETNIFSAHLISEAVELMGQ